MSTAGFRETAYDRVLAALEGAGWKPGKKGMWHCPAHDDRNPSLHVTQKSDLVVLRCFAGCTNDSVVAALGLNMSDLFDQDAQRGRHDRPGPSPKRRIVASYDYHDADREVRSTKRRWEPKDFTWTNGNPRVLYKLPILLESEHVWLNEGEKAADKLQEILPTGHASTCTPAFENKWVTGYTDVLQGKAVTVIRDRDQSGDKQARQAYHALREAGIDVRAVETPVHKEKADAFDHVEAGLGHNDFVDVDLDSKPSESKDREQQPRSIRSRTLDKITQRQIEWLWPGKIERGGPMLLDGDGDAGKTTLVCDLVARATAGTTWPDKTPVERPIRVGWIEGDPDGFATKIAPIIAQAGGDLSMVEEIMINDAEVYGGIRLPRLPGDLGDLIPFLEEKRIELLVLSPVSAMLAKGCNPNSEHDVREAMMPVTRALDAIGCSQVWIRHLNKDPRQTSAAAKGLGSVAWRAITRTALFLARHDSDDEDGRRALVVTKANNVPDHDRSGLIFRLVGEMGDVPKIQWLGETDLDPDSLIDDAEGKLGECRGWLRDHYNSRPHGTAIATKEIARLGKEKGFSDSTIKRAYRAETVADPNRDESGKVISWLRILREDS